VAPRALGRTCALVGALAAAARADAAPAADLVVVWAPGGDVAPIKAVADKRGAALIDRSPVIVPPPQTAQLLKKAIDAVTELRYNDAADPLDQAIGAVDRTGAAGLTTTQLADLFFTRSRLRYAQGSSNLGWDDLVESVVIDPTRVFDPALFSPKDLADIKRAQDAVQQLAQPFLVVDAPFGCATVVDAKPIASSEQFYVGTHWVRVTCPDREPWSARVELTGKGAKVVATPALLAPPSDADVLVQARSSSARALVVVEVHGKVATARLVGIDGRERDRRTVGVARDLAPVATLVDELLAPELVRDRRWYRSKWAYAAGAALVAAAVLVPLTAVIAGGNSSATFTVKPRGLSW
jgi:hypothetical protein